MWHLIFAIIALYACIQFPFILIIAIIIIGIWGIINHCEKKPKSIDKKKESIKENLVKEETKGSTPKPKQSIKTEKELPPECEFFFEERSASNFDIPE
jgi:Na+-transporting methylmalonyl-CoA/oxaloacetate decarboxylase gamma subunit